jgi:hypothetical protein
MGPQLNSFSAQGVTGQSQPLVGLSTVTDKSGTSGFYPIFASSASNIVIEPANAYWVNVYGAGGTAASSVACKQGDVIIGVRYASHVSAKQAPLSQVPDIQCSKLGVTQMNAYGIGTTHTATITTGTDTVTAATTDSVKDLHQCVSPQQATFVVTASTQSCSSQSGPAAPSFLIRLVVERHRARHKGLGGTPGLIDFLVTTDDTFGGSSSDAAPWVNENVLGNSPEFLSSTIISGAVISVSTSISTDGGAVSIGCSNVWGCQHGKCSAESGCECEAGFTGKVCEEKTDACGAGPCYKGTCSSSSTAPAGYSCSCPQGFSGSKCEISSDPCYQLDTAQGIYKAVNCGNGACTASGSSYSCTCDPGFAQSTGTPTGECDGQKDDCVGQWRAGACSGACEQQLTFLILNQATGSGKACPNKNGETKSASCTWGECQSCLGKDCNSRGTCSPTAGSCTCSAGYSGSNCEQQNDQCSMTQCSGHGNCAGATCQCLNAWTSSPSASGIFCTMDPCAACPIGQCDSKTGLCHCVEGQPGQANGCLAGQASDCVGSWGAFGTCGSDCLQHKYYTVTSPAMGAGKSCPNQSGDTQSQACSSGNCCRITASQCHNGAQFLAGSCECLCTAGFQGGFCDTPTNDATAVVSKETTIASSAASSMGVQPTTQAADASKSSSDSSTIFGLPAIAVYAGGGGIALLIIVGAYFAFKKKEAPKAEDPYAALEGMEGMEDVDFGALGLDDSALAAEPKN